jgi:Methyltransferase domain
MRFEDLKHHVVNAFENAQRGISKVTYEILCMHGMTGEKTRHFYNNLLNMEDARYLEIGVWKGSSVCSAMCNNKALVFCMDNFSEFGGPKEEFLRNFNRFKGENKATFIEADCFKVDTSNLPKFNIYMYDGNHSDENHYNALVHYYNCLDNMFVFIVDDWNWENIRTSTMESIKKLNLNILYSNELRTTQDNTHSKEGDPGKIAWHNGIYFAILQKPN